MESLEKRLVLKKQSYRDDVSGRQGGGWGQGWDHSTYEYSFFNGEKVELEGSVNAIEALNDGFDFFGKVTKKQLVEYVAEFYKDFKCENNCWKDAYVKKLTLFDVTVNTARHHVLIEGRRYFKQFKAIKECLCETIKDLKHREFICSQGVCEVLVFRNRSKTCWFNLKDEIDAHKIKSLVKTKCGIPTFGEKDCGRHE